MIKDPNLEDARIMPYLTSLRNLQSVNPEMQQKIADYILRIEQLLVPKKIVLLQVGQQTEMIDKAVGDEQLKDIYSNIDVISIHLPNFKEAKKNFDTILTEENKVLASFIVDLIGLSNEIFKDYNGRKKE